MGTSRRIVLTRSEARNQSWAERLAEEGLPYLLLPLTEHHALPWAEEFERCDGDWLLFTSPTGAEFFMAGRKTADPWKIAALGTGTRRIFENAGWVVDFGPDANDGREFAVAFAEAHREPAKIILPGPLHRLDEPRATLQAEGYSVTELALYETRELTPKAELQTGDVVFFCSPSAVRSFAKSNADRPNCVAIGGTTAAACRVENFQTRVAESPDLQAMIRAARLDV